MAFVGNAGNNCSRMVVDSGESADDQREVSLNDVATERRVALFDVIGGHGPWQFRLWVLFFAATLCTSAVLFSVLFLPPQTIPCHGNATASLSVFNGTLSEAEAKGFDNSVNKLVNCSSFDCPNGTVSKPSIENYFYRNEVNTNPECRDPEKEVLGRSVFFLAFASSAVFLLFAKKRFGRRSISLASCLFLLASSLALCFAEAVSAFLTLRFVVCFSVANIYFNSALTLTQYVHKDFKLLYFLVGHLGWGLAHFLLPLVSWLVQGWLPFHLFMACLVLVLAVLTWCCPDSPNSNYRLSRTRKALKYAAFANGFSTSDVDLLPLDCILRQDALHHPLISQSFWQKSWRITSTCSIFLLTFTSTFLYFAAKWHLGWFGVVNVQPSFAFLGTTEVAGTLILLFLTSVVAAKHLWSLVAGMTSLLLVVTYCRNKDEGATPSLKIFAVLMFFASAGWTLVLVRAFCLGVASANRKLNCASAATALFCGALAASVIALEAGQGELIILLASLHLVFCSVTVFAPDSIFGVLE